VSDSQKKENGAKPSPPPRREVITEPGSRPGRESTIEKRGGQTAPANAPALPLSTSLPTPPPPATSAEPAKSDSSDK